MNYHWNFGQGLKLRELHSFTWAFHSQNHSACKSSKLTLIDKSWKTHPETFPKFQFSGTWLRQISGKLIQQYFGRIYSFGGIFQKSACIIPEIQRLTIGWVFHQSVHLFPVIFSCGWTQNWMICGFYFQTVSWRHFDHSKRTNSAIVTLTNVLMQNRNSFILKSVALTWLCHY